MKKLRFGLVGLGYFGKNYLRLLKEIKGIELAAVASQSTQLTASGLLKRNDIDCVVLATPVKTHFDLALEALENGKHVLIEKPMTSTLKEARELKKAAGKSNSVVMVGHQYLFNDYARFLYNNIGKLGKASNVIAEHLYNGPVRQDIGCLWDAGTHQLAMIQYLLNPGRIKTAKGMSVCRNIKGIDDFTSASIKFESGLTASLILTWLMPEKTRKLTIFGNEMTAIFDDTQEKDKLRFFGKKTEIPKIKAKEPLRNEVEHFMDCIKNGKKPLTSVESSYQITEWLDEISKNVN